MPVLVGDIMTGSFKVVYSRSVGRPPIDGKTRIHRVTIRLSSEEITGYRKIGIKRLREYLRSV